MKKIIPMIVIISLLYSAAYTQSIELYHDGTLLSNGDNVAVLENPSEFLITAHIGFKNITTESLPVKVKMHEVDVIAGTTHYFCFGGSCYPPGTAESPGAYTLAAGELSENQFYADYMPNGIQGTSRVKYTFFKESNVNDSVCVVVSFISGYLGMPENLLDQIRLSGAYPNPANGSTSFNYTLPAGICAAKLEVHNLLGSVVREAVITDTRGQLTISTVDLQEGMYFYTLRAGNRSVATGKLMIRH
ncbi:MAG: T9SS type A sorting domain-containing protein [Bacteroidales bacterium]|nr:T9SS type A sorting domain-containing protein [Lentimicrobiaceae bacterium]MDD5695138.1 T9SS type A sorting domain-containing protein [Bacteroidales bacterium]